MGIVKFDILKHGDAAVFFVCLKYYLLLQI